MLEKFFLLKVLNKAPAVVGHIYTLFFVVVSWAIFAIEDFAQLGAYLKVMFGLGGVPLVDAQLGYYVTSYLPHSAGGRCGLHSLGTPSCTISSSPGRLRLCVRCWCWRDWLCAPPIW